MACTCGHSEPIVPARTEPQRLLVRLCRLVSETPGTMELQRRRRRPPHGKQLSKAEAALSEAAEQWNHCPKSSDVLWEQVADHAMRCSSSAPTLDVLHVPIVPAWPFSAKNGCSGSTCLPSH